MLHVNNSTELVENAFARDVVGGLSADVKTLPSRWLYDERGSALFEEITKLDEYYLTRAETSILQALALMNGKLTSDATDLEKSETLVAVAEAPFLETRQRVESLFLATLSRKPADEELALPNDSLWPIPVDLPLLVERE